MGIFRNISAYVLFLLFLRVLVPDKVVVAMHTHAHTEETRDKHQAHIAKQHTHCPVDTLFDSPFEPAASVFLSSQWPNFTTAYKQAFAQVWKFCYPQNTYLRGPPALV